MGQALSIGGPPKNIRNEKKLFRLNILKKIMKALRIFVLKFVNGCILFDFTSS